MIYGIMLAINAIKNWLFKVLQEYMSVIINFAIKNKRFHILYYKLKNSKIIKLLNYY
jgi:hypothetical protein